MQALQNGGSWRGEQKQKTIKKHPFPTHSLEGGFERKKLLFRLRCKLPGAQGNLVYRIWPIFAKICASY